MSNCKPIQGEFEFTLLARDKSAPELIRQWAYVREREVIHSGAPEADMAKVAQARQIANEMEAWRAANDGEWRKPQPEPVKLSPLQQNLIVHLDGIRDAIISGNLGGRTTQIVGLDFTITFKDLDVAKFFTATKTVGIFPIPPDAQFMAFGSDGKPMVRPPDTRH